MKGVNKRVVEIVEPQNEYIERVIVFLRQNNGDIKVSKGRSEAEKYVSGLVCWKRKFLPAFQPWMKTALLLGAGALLVGLGFFLFL